MVYLSGKADSGRLERIIDWEGDRKEENTKVKASSGSDVQCGCKEMPYPVDPLEGHQYQKLAKNLYNLNTSSCTAQDASDVYFEAISRAIKDISETISQKYDILMFEKNGLRNGQVNVVVVTGHEWKEPRLYRHASLVTSEPDKPFLVPCCLLCDLFENCSKTQSRNLDLRSSHRSICSHPHRYCSG